MIVLIFLRYVFVSWVFYYIYYVSKGGRLEKRRINTRRRKPKQSRKEIRNSFFSSIFFALGATALLFMYNEGYTKIYIDFSEYGITYLLLSGFLVAFIHDTYYYWIHRLMHIPRIYKLVHKKHHQSIVTSPWTAFSFDPTEAILQGVFMPVLVFVLPINYLVLHILLVMMTLSATINHLGVEIYPKNFQKHPIGKWVIGATHHSLHHSEFITNYGLYFTFWDIWMATESKSYKDSFEETIQKKIKTNNDSKQTGIKKAINK